MEEKQFFLSPDLVYRLAAIEKSLSALRRMKKIAEGFQTTELKTIATRAVREAANGQEFCRRVHEELGLEIEVIGAQQEALLAFASVNRAFGARCAAGSRKPRGSRRFSR